MAGTSSGTSGSGAAGGPAELGPGITLTPKNARTSLGGNIQFSAVVTGFPDTSVTWKIEESDGGDLSDSGRYTAPSTAGTYHIVATAVADTSLKDSAAVTVGGPPNDFLQPGVWTNITPPVDLEQSAAGVLCVAVDTANPGTVYAGIEKFGIWKTNDGGQNWVQLGNPDDEQNYDEEEDFLDFPVNMYVDPSDPDHLYATQGVRGRTLGFFVSHDGGNKWFRPAGFKAVSPTNDVTTMAVDPSDFSHVLLGSHSTDNVGVLESSDGGESWVIHPPSERWGGPGSYGVSFLYHPQSNTGDRNTWLVQHEGLWRTKDAGTTWTKVGDYGGVHHGTDRVYFTNDGVAYSGGSNYPLRSRDNGLTWEQVTDGVPNMLYHTIHGDGVSLFTLRSPYYGVEPLPPFLTSSDGTTWKPYEHDGVEQQFPQGPIQMRFDPADRVLYSAHWEQGGLWALKSPN